jgi:hypothetical protein
MGIGREEERGRVEGDEEGYQGLEEREKGEGVEA